MRIRNLMLVVLLCGFQAAFAQNKPSFPEQKSPLAQILGYKKPTKMIFGSMDQELVKY